MSVVVVARLWFAPGVEVFPGRIVPSPPPLEISMNLFPRTSVNDPIEDPDAPLTFQRATFRLASVSDRGGVVHYDLVPNAPQGWRWIAVDGRIRTERVEAT